MTKLGISVCLMVGLAGCGQIGSNEPGPNAEEPIAEAPADEIADLSRVDLESAPSRGPRTAPVTIAVFCDFECPYCKRLQPRLQELQKAHPGNLRVVFKQLPLPMHAHARLAAKAALAADEQGRFWELHDLMFRSEGALDREAIEALATRAGLDLDRFRTAIDSGSLDQKLDRDLGDADRLGARGTPTSFVNGKKITGAQPLEVFDEAVTEALAR